jgi:hypothetical protein
VRHLAAAALVVLPGIAAGVSTSSRAVTWPCGISNAAPVWIDYVDATVPFWKQFARPGLVTAAPPGTGVIPAALREHGASVVLFDLKLGNRVGTPDAPADQSTVADAADKVFDAAAELTGCATPLIAENELNGAAAKAPWSAENALYHANVLAYLTQLAARGAHPYLLVPSSPSGGEIANDWWPAVAQVADIVREFFPSPPDVSAQGPVVGSRTLRNQMRQATTAFTSIGVPASRLGLMLELESGVYGRNGLTPSSAWFEFVKLDALAAGQIADEFGLPTIWSWGWATYNVKSPFDADKQAAACVYLWARDQSLCDGPSAAGAAFDSSLSEGQLILPPGVFCTLGGAGAIASGTRAALSRVTRDHEVAATIALGWAATRSEAAVTSGQIDTAEQGVVDAGFGGSRTAYLAALERRGANPGLARAAMGGELRRLSVAARLAVAPVSSASVAAFYAASPALEARLVTTKLPTPWLGGRTRGFALQGYAPAGVFAGGGGSRLVQTATGAVEVKVLEPSRPLHAIPFAAARPAIAAAVKQRTEDDAYESWLRTREESILAAAVCAHDDVPAAGPSELTAFLPFLRLSA